MNPTPKINALGKIHACQDGFQVNRVLLIPECVMTQELDVLAGDERNALEQFQGLLISRRLVAAH
jgi:hypothetical protein